MVSPLSSKKTVRFPEEETEIALIVCEIPTREEFTNEDKEMLFFSKEEYQVSRTAAKLVSKESHRNGESKNLENTFIEKNEETQCKLNNWARRGHNRRGLERWINRDHGEKRQNEQFAAIQSVLEAQEEMQIRGKEVDHEKLRKVSHKATKTSRHFARMMGKADSYAIANELKGMDDSLSIYGNESITSTMSTASISSQSGYSHDDSISLPRVDEVRDTYHDGRQKVGRFSRFSKFRRSTKGKSDEGSCSKVVGDSSRSSRIP